MRSSRKPPIRRVTLALGFLVFASAGVLLALHWDTVAVHIEAWRFQLSGDTVTISPGKVRSVSLTGEAFGRNSTRFELESLLGVLSDQSGYPVVYNPADNPKDPGNLVLPAGMWWPRRPSEGDYGSRPSFTVLCTGDMALSILAENGWRVIAQRFPRRAYILMRAEDPGAPESSVETTRVFNASGKRSVTDEER